jgi:tetratricopeptide (TPR) repeat protein
VYEAAAASLQAADTAHAKGLLTKYLQTSPKDCRALNLLGIALTQEDRVDDANEAFRTAIGICPDFYPAAKNLAINEYSKGRFDDAARLFQDVLKTVSNDEVANAYLGELAYRKDDYPAAARFYANVHGSVLRQPSLLLHAADSALKVNKTSQAEELLARLPRDDAALQFKAGLLLGKAERFHAAAIHFDLSRALYPDRQTAQYDYLLMLLRAGEEAQAIRAGKQLLISGEKFLPETYQVLSEALLKSGAITEAWNVLRAASEADANQEQTYIQLSSIAQDYQNYDLALDVLNIGLARLPRSVNLRVQHGVMRILKGQKAEAKADFEAAHELDTTAVSPILALSVSLIEEGSYETASQLLRNAIGTGPGEGGEWYFLGKAISRSGVSTGNEGAEAEQAFAAAVRLDPTFAPAHVELGKSLLNRGATAEGISELEMALSLDPANRTAMTQLVRGYRRHGDEKQATAMSARLARAVTAGRDEEVHAALKRIVRLDGSHGTELYE